jgi:hypothetical protein
MNCPVVNGIFASLELVNSWGEYWVFKNVVENENSLIVKKKMTIHQKYFTHFLHFFKMAKISSKSLILNSNILLFNILIDYLKLVKLLYKEIFNHGCYYMLLT